MGEGILWNLRFSQFIIIEVFSIVMTHGFINWYHVLAENVAFFFKPCKP
jgi:uncharacterized membrane protein